MDHDSGVYPGCLFTEIEIRVAYWIGPVWELFTVPQKRER